MIVRNGDLDLHLADDGDPDGPPILLLHGITSSGRTWDWLVPELADRHRVLRLDFRGHGRSDRAPGAYQPADYVSDAVAALHAVGRPCLVVGHSLGGITAAALAQHHPDLLTGVVMEDPPLASPTAATRPATLDGSALLTGFQAMRRSIPRLQESGTTVAVLAGLLATAPDTTGTSTFGEALTPDGLESMAEAMLTVDATVLDPVLDGTATDAVSPTLPFGVPALLVAGDPDQPDTIARPRTIAHHASLSPDLEVVVVPGAGHLIHDGKASRSAFEDALRGFLARVGPTGGAEQIDA